MKKKKTSKKMWLDWIAVQKDVASAWLESGDHQLAIEILDYFLAEEPLPDLWRDAVAFRGLILDDCKKYDLAKQDFCAALTVARSRRLECYSLELYLAVTCIKNGDSDEAEMWCLAGLETAARDQTVSGASVLRRLLELRGSSGLTGPERRLAEKAVRQAWKLLRVEGEPDLGDLAGCARALLNAQGKPFSKEHPPAPIRRTRALSR